MRTYLNVPFSEKESAKRLGAKWDGMRWYVDNMSNLKPFLKWMPEHLTRAYSGANAKVKPTKIQSESKSLNLRKKANRTALVSQRETLLAKVKSITNALEFTPIECMTDIHVEAQSCLLHKLQDDIENMDNEDCLRDIYTLMYQFIGWNFFQQPQKLPSGR